MFYCVTIYRGFLFKICKCMEDIFYIYFNFHKWCWIHLHMKHEPTAGETTCRSTEMELCVCTCVSVCGERESWGGGEVRRAYCEFTLRRKSRLTLANQTSCPLPYLHLSLPSVVLHSHQIITSRCQHTGMDGNKNSENSQVGVCTTEK